MNLSRFRSIVPLLLASSFLAIPSGAQESRKPAVTASLILVGANSDSRWVGDGPGMRAIPLDPDAAPPSTLSIRAKDGFTVIPATLNRPSPALPVRAGKLRVYANQEAGPDEEPPLFGDYSIPDTPGHYDVFLNRSKTRKTWDKADSVVLPSATTSFPNGSFRIINLSELPVMLQIGTSKLSIAARKTRIFQPSSKRSGRLLKVTAAHADGDSHRIILRTGIRSSSEQRTNLVFYPGRDKAKPCKATWYHQAPPGSLAPEKEKETP